MPDHVLHIAPNLSPVDPSIDPAPALTFGTLASTLSCTRDTTVPISAFGRKYSIILLAENLIIFFLYYLFGFAAETSKLTNKLCFRAVMDGNSSSHPNCRCALKSS
jgi:hypothetical protein